VAASLHRHRRNILFGGINGFIGCFYTKKG